MKSCRTMAGAQDSRGPGGSPGSRGSRGSRNSWGSRHSQGVLAAERGIFKGQLGLATRRELIEAGVTNGEIRLAIAQGRWIRAATGLYALANWPDMANRRLLAACLAGRGVASHASAAWVWGLLDDEPEPLSISVPHGRRATLPAPGPRIGGTDLGGVVVHHSRDLSDESTSTWRGIPTTKPQRTLVDLAATSKPTLLDAAIDAALARRLVAVEGLLAEALRMKRSGRRGPAQLMAALKRRGFVGAPSPSVLESRTLRLLKSAGVKVEQCEAVVEGGRYRLDVQLEPHLFLELDGYAYHWSPEQKRYDDARRNTLRLHGHEILVYDWTVITKDGGRLIREVKAALAARRRGTYV